MSRSVTGSDGALAAKYFIIAIIFIILTVLGSLLVRELHRWFSWKKLRKAIFALTLFAVCAALVYFAEIILEKPEVGVLPTIFSALILSRIYEEERRSWRSGLFLPKAEYFSIGFSGEKDDDLVQNAFCWMCLAGAVLLAFSYGAYFFGHSFTTALCCWGLGSFFAIALAGIYGEIKSWSDKTERTRL